MPAPEAAVAVLAKVAGAVIGSILALVYMPPKTGREFASRAGSGIVAGTVAAPQIARYLEWPADAENMLAAGALGGFLSWWAMGAVIRLAQGWKK